MCIRDRDVDERCRGDREVAPSRFRSVDDLIARTGINREELSVLAEIGALNAFGHTRREALWQVERAIRPAGDMLSDAQIARSSDEECPLPVMSPVERLVADYEGTGLTSARTRWPCGARR